MTPSLLTRLQSQGWQIDLYDRPHPLPPVLTARYPALPAPWRDWLRTVRRMVHRSETAWFLCAGDYAGRTDSAFRWNEWELLSLESAAGDDAWSREIRAFWDRHLPILQSVAHGYAYCALDLLDGSVVCGAEPEFEDCRPAASSLPALLESLAAGTAPF